MPDGSLLLGTGNEGKLLKLAGGNVTVLAETKALVITSLAQAFGGAVVAGTRDYLAGRFGDAPRSLRAQGIGG